MDAATVASLPTNVVKYPQPVEGRVAHIDADFIAYQVSAESKAELDPEDPTPRKSLEDMKHNAFEAVDHIRRMACANTAVLHTTHNSDKGGRDSHAILKAYQANRLDRENRPEQLDTIRLFLSQGVADKTGTFVGCNHTDQEADDGMAQAAYADPENAIVCSADKDLDMVPWLRMDMTTYEITNQQDPFGWIETKDMISPTTGKKYATKVIGRGTKFFWAQVLMGDSADNISGLPEVAGSIWQEYAGTKAYNDTMKQLIACDDPEKAKKLEDKVDKLRAKTKKCGPVLTFNLLEDKQTDRECFIFVRSLYKLLEEKHGYEFRHWETGNRVTPTQALLSEMRLLWMRRYKDTDDVIKWIKEATS